MVDFTRVPGIAEGHRYRNDAVGVVYIFVLMAVLGAMIPADEEPNAGGANGGDTSDGAALATTTVTASPTPTATTKTTRTPRDTYAIQITYDGDWAGALSVSSSGGSTSRSISGSGDKTITVYRPDVISVNAQKQDDRPTRLTLQILHNGRVVAESSTWAAYGVAAVGESFR